MFSLATLLQAARAPIVGTSNKVFSICSYPLPDIFLQFQPIFPKGNVLAQSLARLETEIKKLQRQRDALRKREVAGVVQRIRAAIDYYGLTAADLGFRSSGRKPNSTGRAGVANVRKAARKNAPVRFRDEAGNTWSGRGRRPHWFVAALEAGKTESDLAVKQ